MWAAIGALRGRKSGIPLDCCELASCPSSCSRLLPEVAISLVLLCALRSVVWIIRSDAVLPACLALITLLMWKFIH